MGRAPQKVMARVQILAKCLLSLLLVRRAEAKIAEPARWGKESAEGMWWRATDGTDGKQRKCAGRGRGNVPAT
jgi:hypothetical protein